MLNEIEGRVKAKIEAAGTPLKEWDVQINYGIKTGFNEAFIIDESTKNKLLKASPKSVEIIRPILRGRDIKRYNAIKSDLWIIFTRRGIDIEKHPEVKKHLMQYYDDLKPKAKGDKKGRKPGAYKWYELQDNVAFYKELAKSKIVWGNLNSKPNFSVDYDGNYISSPSVILVPTEESVEYLLAILNSAICHFYISQFSYGRENGYIEYQKQFVEQLPVPREKSNIQEQLTKLTKQIIACKDSDVSYSELEKIIETLIFDLYEFTAEERTYINQQYAVL